MNTSETQKKFWIATLLVICITMGSQAANYVVYYVKGDVKYVQGGKTVSVKERMEISPQAVFVLGKGSSLILKDESNSRLPVVKGPCKGKIEKLVKKGKGSFLQRSAEFFAHLAGRSRTAAKEEVTYMRSMGSVVRESPMPDEDGQIVRPVKVEVPQMDTELMSAFDNLEDVISELEREE